MILKTRLDILDFDAYNYAQSVSLYPEEIKKFEGLNSFSMPIDKMKAWIDEKDSKARDAMLQHTSTPHAPWYIVDANIKRHARLNVITHLLSQIPYDDLTPKPLKLPPRQKAGDYKHPDFSAFNFVPSEYP